MPVRTWAPCTQLATQVISRCLHSFKWYCLRALFEASTGAEMAVEIVRSQAGTMGKREVGQLLAELETMLEQEARSGSVRDPPQVKDKTVWSRKCLPARWARALRF